MPKPEQTPPAWQHSVQFDLEPRNSIEFFFIIFINWKSYHKFNEGNIVSCLGTYFATGVLQWKIQEFGYFGEFPQCFTVVKQIAQC